MPRRRSINPICMARRGMRCGCVRTSSLVGNALKYGGVEPIDVSVRRRDRQAIVTVRDRGPGIPPEFLPRIFNRFERAPGSGMDGVGRGLYICRAVVEAHDGTIDAASGSDGSTFTVRLPLSVDVQNRS
ncbi:MAG TPA: HAMP domain-containing sensor histidine kinase [Chloroflexota bacterium]|nr:HAMP domain-containing sensor histidine kinase [Chloroflexota bacterium]